ncbi:MAG: DUF4438 domain-containing protein [Pseudomonadota bacterium]
MFKSSLFLASILLLSGTLPAQQLEPIRYNADELIEQAVLGEISPPAIRDSVYRVEADGTVRLMPGTGTITYNFRTGDTAVHMAGNHVEPAVSLYNLGTENSRTGNDNRALNALSTIGSKVTVVSGFAQGAEGWVIGKHGGVEHVMVDFDDDAVYDQLVIGDRMQVRSFGVGMELTNIEGVKVLNMSPKLLDAMNEAGAGVTSEGKLRVGITHQIPARIMGSGLGRDHAFTGDYDIQFFDEQTVEEYHLNSLRFGDIVAIVNADSSYGRIYKQGAITIGVIVHGRSESAGHGPGVTTLFTSADGNIELFIDDEANLTRLLDIRSHVDLSR